jgi:hypothetical protein
MTPTLSRNIPFFDYPQLFTSEEELLMAIVRDVGRRGAFILQHDLERFEENLARFLEPAIPWASVTRPMD